MGGRGADADLGAPALHGDDRFEAGDSASQPAELPRVAERLEVEQDDVSVGVVLPVLQEVVAADVGLVAHRDERRHAQAGARCCRQHCHAERSGLGQEADRAATGRNVGEGGIHPDVGVGVDDADAIGSDHTHPRASRGGDGCTLERGSFLADLGETATDDDQTLHLLPSALFDDIEHLFGWHGEDRDVDVVGYVGDAGPCAHAGDGTGGPVHRIDRAVEPVSEKIHEQLVADRAGAMTGTDDCNRSRPEKTCHGGRLGMVLAAFDGGDRSGCLHE